MLNRGNKKKNKKIGIMRKNRINVSKARRGSKFGNAREPFGQKKNEINANIRH